VKPGDVVRFKSGGAAMTVIYVKDDEVFLAWMSDAGLPNRSCRGLPIAALELLTVAPAEQPDVKLEQNEQCRCGHHRAIEHNETGCLLGCSAEQCEAHPEAGE
jgi:hypothetical protein